MPSCPQPRHSRIAIVTGARGGIGARWCSACKHRATAWRWWPRCRQPDSLAADARIAADTTEPQGAQAAIAACRELLGGPPTLLAHCGQHLIAPLHRTTAAQWREVMRVNLDSGPSCCKPGCRRCASRARRVRRCSRPAWWPASAWPTTRRLVAAKGGGSHDQERSRHLRPQRLRINAVAPA